PDLAGDLDRLDLLAALGDQVSRAQRAAQDQQHGQRSQHRLALPWSGRQPPAGRRRRGLPARLPAGSRDPAAPGGSAVAGHLLRLSPAAGRPRPASSPAAQRPACIGRFSDRIPLQDPLSGVADNPANMALPVISPPALAALSPRPPAGAERSGL